MGKDSSMNAAFVYDEVFLTHEMPPSHPESARRLSVIVDTLRQTGIWERLVHLRPVRATTADICLAHAPEYVEQIRNFGEGYLDPDTYLSEKTCEAALFAAGALMKAVDACLSAEAERVFCAVRPPGHHAEYGRVMGFCIFNNVAVGARYAQGKGFRKVMIADFDVHHGNGTQNIFYEDDTVYYFSTHQHPHYPGTGRADERGAGKGEGFTCNIPLPSGAGDDELIEAYADTFRREVGNFDPDLIMVSAGYDLHRNDPLAGFTVSDEGVERVVREITSAKEGVPVIFTLEGGYHLESLANSVTATLRVLGT